MNEFRFAIETWFLVNTSPRRKDFPVRRERFSGRPSCAVRDGRARRRPRRSNATGSTASMRVRHARAETRPVTQACAKALTRRRHRAAPRKVG
jgi:hypothetical protein